MGIVLDILYFLGLLLLSPMWLYRMIRHGRYRHDIGQRFGAAPRRYGLQPVIWVHGVSVGEINAAGSLVQEIHSQLPDFRVVVSTSTDTGMAAAKRLFAPDHTVFRWPLDFTCAVRRALKRVQPALVVLMEGEVWPNFLAACNRRGIPAVVVNGRLSADKGYPRYRKIGRLAARLFNRLTAIGAQNEDYAERYLSLGVDEKKLYVTGMLKYDSAALADHLDGQDALAAALGVADEDRLIVAGGTGPGEEAILLDVYEKLTARHERLKLALVPRKPERFEEVARLVASRGGALLRRSEHADGTTPDAPAPVILGDTMGELRKFYALGEVVFVGRSLVNMGGSDMIEAAALARPTAFGPHTFNFPQADDLAAHGCARVTDAAALVEQFDAWLADPAAARQAGREAQEYVRSQQGATRRNVQMLCDVLGRVPARLPGGISTDKVRGA